MQDCNNSTANALELLQSCTKPYIYSVQFVQYSSSWNRHQGNMP